MSISSRFQDAGTCMSNPSLWYLDSLERCVMGPFFLCSRPLNLVLLNDVLNKQCNEDLIACMVCVYVRERASNLQSKNWTETKDHVWPLKGFPQSRSNISFLSFLFYCFLPPQILTEVFLSVRQTLWILWYRARSPHCATSSNRFLHSFVGYQAVSHLTLITA